MLKLKQKIQIKMRINIRKQNVMKMSVRIFELENSSANVEIKSMFSIWLNRVKDVKIELVLHLVIYNYR
jgi:hypothetical protein